MCQSVYVTKRMMLAFNRQSFVHTRNVRGTYPVCAIKRAWTWWRRVAEYRARLWVMYKVQSCAEWRTCLPPRYSVDQSHQGMSHFSCLAQSRAGMYIQNISSDLHSEMALFGVPQTWWDMEIRAMNPFEAVLTPCQCWPRMKKHA